MKFADKLKAVRAFFGLSQEELANRIGTTKQTISRYESGSREPNLRTARSYAEKLGIDLTIFADDSLSIPTPEKIVEMRKSHGLSLGECASRAGISETRLQQLENGEVFPTSLELVKLSRILFCSSDYLLGQEWFSEDSSGPAPNEDELRLLKKYRCLTPEGQAKMQDYADDLIETGRYSPSAQKADIG